MSPTSRHSPYANPHVWRGDIDTRILERATHDIEKFGWHMMGIIPTLDDPSPVKLHWGYSVGFWKTYESPEMVVFGLRPELAHGCFSRVVDLIKQGQTFVHGTRTTEIAEGYETVFRTVPTDHDEYPFRSAGVYYGHYDFPAVQMVLPDVNGKFPWDEGVDPRMVISQQLMFDGPATDPTQGR